MKGKRISDPRQLELAKIHVAKKQLGLDDVTYRDMLFTLTRKRSSAELDRHERHLVIEHLKTRGFRDHQKRGTPAVDKAAQTSKVRALLMAAGRPDAYADGMANHMFTVTRFEWLTAGQLRKLIAALTYDAARRARRAQAASVLAERPDALDIAARKMNTEGSEP